MSASGTEKAGVPLTELAMSSFQTISGSNINVVIILIIPCFRMRRMRSIL